MAKVAKIVVVSLATRVIVDSDATDEQIMSIADEHFKDMINNAETLQNVVSIYDDEECPYDGDDS